jgi:chorismate mutase
MKKGNDMRTDGLAAWGLEQQETFLAAGPCSAETEDQVLTTARALAGQGIGFFRAGLWKPRTRPGSFEGVGALGLPWLERVRRETGLKVGTEVAEPAHVEACLESGLDVLWIGARTTTNPFSVQAIADALRGTQVPVWVKNPMSEDVGLWIGALERLANAGVSKLGAIHRGVGSPLEMRCRNAPAWKMPVELMRRMPEIPVLCDPSHICGRAELIASIAQEAMDLLFDGLMVEVHCDPPQAWSDAAQQLTPDQFKKMIAALKMPRAEGGRPEYEQKMSALRGRVDELDGHLLEVLRQRMGVVREMGALKTEENISTLQPVRWQSVLADRVRHGRGLGFAEDFVEEFMQLIHEESIRQQEEERIKGGE